MVWYGRWHGMAWHITHHRRVRHRGATVKLASGIGINVVARTQNHHAFHVSILCCKDEGSAAVRGEGLVDVRTALQQNAHTTRVPCDSHTHRTLSGERQP